MPGARTLTIVVGACLSVGLFACSSPTKPGVTVASARPVSPTNGAQLSYYKQPVTLVAANGVATGGSALTDTFEVATDAAFSNSVTMKAVPQGLNGQSSLALDQLSPKDYYWRVRTLSSDAAAVSTTFKFSIGPLLVIDPPVLIKPMSNSFQHKRPTFTVRNAGHTGPSADLVYHFVVSADPAFSMIILAGDVPQAADQTSFTPTTDLVSGASFYWHVQAVDPATNVSSAYSVSQSFTTVNPDDGSFPYTLVLHVPSACVNFVLTNRVDYPANGTLIVSGDSLHFSLPQYSRWSSDPSGVSVDISRTGTQLSGTIGGGVSFMPNDYPLLGPPLQAQVGIWQMRGVIDHSVFSGNEDNHGRLTGTYNSFLFGYNGYGETLFDCEAGSALTWTLTSH
jgi:hypothetical protein